MSLEISEEKLIEAYRLMVRIRFFEERVAELKNKNLIPGYPHTCIGQEATVVGVSVNLRDDDYVTSTHRGHGHNLGRGADPKKMFAELMGRVDGYCRGRGGSMHACAFDKNVMGVYAVVGDGVPVATGVGLAIHLRKEDKVVVCYFSDGAANTGAFHEGINMAAVWKLPVVFVCENNQYALTTHWKKTFNIEKISERGPGYGIPGVSVDGNDVIEVYKAAEEAISRARAGKGPTLIEARTYRVRGSAEGGDPNLGEAYRSLDEVREWMKKDPLPRYEKYLTDSKILDESGLKRIKQEEEELVQGSMEMAEKSPKPKPEDVWIGIGTLEGKK